MVGHLRTLPVEYLEAVGCGVVLKLKTYSLVKLFAVRLIPKYIKQEENKINTTLADQGWNDIEYVPTVCLVNSSYVKLY